MEKKPIPIIERWKNDPEPVRIIKPAPKKALKSKGTKKK